MTLTDREGLLPLMRENIALNPGWDVCAESLDWGAPASSPLPVSMPDLVMAADIVYHPESIPLLLATLSKLPASSFICLAYKVRNAAIEQPFWDNLPAQWTVFRFAQLGGVVPVANSEGCPLCRHVSVPLVSYKGIVDVQKLAQEPQIFFFCAPCQACSQL